MNFQTLVKVETADKYLDIAFKATLKRGKELKRKVKAKPISKTKNIELEKIKIMSKVLSKHLKNINESFPSFDQLPEFYQELVKNFIDYGMLKKSLACMKWAVKQIKSLERIYSGKIRASKDIPVIKQHQRSFAGRVSSVVKQINKHLMFLENSRRIMKDFPVVKTGLPTVVVIGFPNVGKTTLLAKLTGSVPDIQPYAFTTKGINIGYIKKDHKKIQVLDTPGTLNRVDKMNAIEYQMHLAIKHCADKIIYVFDLTEPYPLADQKKLYKHVKEYKKPVYVYLSKKDILPKETLAEFKLKHLSFEELKKVMSKT